MVIVSVLASCGHLYYDIDKEVDPDLIPYIEEYKQLKGHYLGHTELEYNTSFFFEHLPGNVVGECRYRGKTRAVVLDPDFWEKGETVSSYVECLRHIVFLHEMGHCDLNRGHTGNPESLMQPSVGLSTGFCSDEFTYLQELFLP